jgi:hypothetical protein
MADVFHLTQRSVCAIGLEHQSYGLWFSSHLSFVWPVGVPTEATTGGSGIQPFNILLYPGSCHLGVSGNLNPIYVPELSPDLDHIVADVFVAHRETSKSPSVSAGSVSLPQMTRPFDVKLTFYRDESSLKVQVEPIASELKRQLDPKCLNGKKYRAFYAGSLSDNDISGLSGQSFLQLKALIEQSTSLGILYRSLNPNQTLSTTASMLLKPEDEAKVLRVFSDYGQTIYRRLLQEDPELADVIEAIEAFATSAAHPIRLRIESTNVYIRWQMLHPPGPVSATNFWGFKYELSVNPLSRGDAGPLLGKLKYGSGMSVLAEYNGNAADDPVTQLGDELAKGLVPRFQPGKFIVVNSRSTLLNDIQEGARRTTVAHCLRPRTKWHNRSRSW